MTIWYVHRPNGPGTPISWAGQYQQPGYATEALDDASNAELQAFLNPVTLQSKLAAGLVVTSIGASALNATYGLDQVSQDQLWNIALGLAAGLGFPGGASTFAYPDITGTPRTFTSAQFTNLAKAVRDYVFAANTQAAIAAQGGTASWPTATATIA